MFAAPHKLPIEDDVHLAAGLRRVLAAGAPAMPLEAAACRPHNGIHRSKDDEALRKAHGNQAQMSRWLGHSRVTVREKLIHFGIHPRQPNDPA